MRIIAVTLAFIVFGTAACGGDSETPDRPLGLTGCDADDARVVVDAVAPWAEKWREVLDKSPTLAYETQPAHKEADLIKLPPCAEGYRDRLFGIGDDLSGGDGCTATRYGSIQCAINPFRADSMP